MECSVFSDDEKQRPANTLDITDTRLHLNSFNEASMHWYTDVIFRKYAVFDGRARRKEYWMFFLLNLIVSFIIGFAAGLTGMADETGNSALTFLYPLAVLVPSIAVGVRRMHDSGHSGWWLLLPLVNLFFLVLDSQPGTNMYGPNPKEPS